MEPCGPTQRRIRTVVAQRDRLDREMLRLILENERDFQVVGGAADVRSVLRMASALNPQVLVIEPHLPGWLGTETAEVLVSNFPTTALGFLPDYADDDALHPIIESGLALIAAKWRAPNELFNAISTSGIWRSFDRNASRRRQVSDAAR